MGTVTQYANGQTLTSSALTLAQINTLIQQWTLGALGLPIDSASSQVRIEWQTQGAPFQNASDDVCYLRCVPKDEDYNKVRYESAIGSGSTTVSEQWNYTRVWSIRWCFYGPNSVDFARMLKSALYQEFFADQLALGELFPVTDFGEAVRAPELIDGQWFERVDFEASFYEWVTETTAVNAVASAEVIIENSDGQIADITVA